MSLLQVLLFGVRPRVRLGALLAATALAGSVLALRVALPAVFLVDGLAFAVVAGGALLAAGTGRSGGGPLEAVAAAALPTFAFDVAAVALARPFPAALGVDGVAGAAWFTLGVTLASGPQACAVGAWSRAPTGAVRDHLGADPAHLGPLVAWTVLTVAGVPVSVALVGGSSTAVAPVPACGALVAAAVLGYRAPGVIPALLAGVVGTVGGFVAFVGGFGSAGGVSPGVLPLLAVAGVLTGVPLGAVGYAIGRTLRLDAGSVAGVEHRGPGGAPTEPQECRERGHRQ